MPSLSTVAPARWAAPGLRVCNDYTELTRGSPHRRSDHGLWPGRVSGLLSSRRAARCARRRRHGSAALAAPLAAAHTSSSTPPSATRAAGIRYRDWPLHWMVWRPTTLRIRLTGSLPPEPLGAQTNEPRARTGLPGPTGWWPHLGSGDGPGAWLDRIAVREMYRGKAGAGGPPALPGSHHLRSGYPGLVPATWAVSGAWGRLPACVLPVT